MLLGFFFVAATPSHGQPCCTMADTLLDRGTGTAADALAQAMHWMMAVGEQLQLHDVSCFGAAALACRASDKFSRELQRFGEANDSVAERHREQLFLALVALHVCSKVRFLGADRH